MFLIGAVLSRKGVPNRDMMTTPVLKSPCKANNPNIANPNPPYYLASEPKATANQIEHIASRKEENEILIVSEECELR
jgi:hypothetical protein